MILGADDQTLSLMPRRKRLILSQPVRTGLKLIKVQLDARTVITLSKIESLAFWKQRYPNAVVLQ